jgi:CHAT domain-containing protein
VLALGDPHFDSEADAVAGTRVSRSAQSDEPGGTALRRLRGSADEARLVAGYARHAEVRLRDSASGHYVRHTPLEAYEIIHFATHAVVDDRAVTRTGLALAAGGGESGFVTPSDLAARPLGGGIVVLSACRAAGEVITTGEGIRGLTAPLLAAGANTVVASQWEVGDRRAKSLMRDFYDALARGSRADEAVREMELAALRSGAPPREWAAFTVTGDPTARVALVQPHWYSGLITRLALLVRQ